MRPYFMLMYQKQKIQLGKGVDFPVDIYRVITILIKITVRFFININKMIPEFIGKDKGTKEI